jgi:hypothetical protein
LIKFVFFAVVASLCVSVATATPLSPSSTWSYQVQYMGVGGFFSTQYTATQSETIVLTAWGAVSDEFNIFVNGVFALSSSVVPDWNDLGMAGAVPVTDFDTFDQVALSGLYSGAKLLVNKGDLIAIQLSHLAPDDGSIYSDGAFGAMAIRGTPEPVTFGLTGLALLALGGFWRRRTASKEQQ